MPLGARRRALRCGRAAEVISIPLWSSRAMKFGHVKPAATIVVASLIHEAETAVRSNLPLAR